MSGADKKTKKASLDLLAAVRAKNLEKVKNILKKPLPNVNDLACDEAGWSALTTAVLMGQIDVVSLILHAGVNPNVRDGMKRTAIYVACEVGNREITRLLLEEHDADLEASCVFGQSALDTVLSKDNKVIKEVIRNYIGKSIIDATTRDQLPRLFELLRHPCCHVNYTDDTGNTALHFAVKFQSEEMIKALVQYGADPELANNAGITPAMIARDHGPRIVNFLQSGKSSSSSSSSSSS